VKIIGETIPKFSKMRFYAREFNKTHVNISAVNVSNQQKRNAIWLRL